MASLYVHLLLSFLFLHILPFLSTVFAISCTQELGSLSSSSTFDKKSWVSPSGEFAMGFRELPSGSFLLAIWFDKIPDRTVVWSANGNNPAPPGSTVDLTDTDGKLVIHNSNRRVLWESPTGSAKVKCAAMNNDGNFMLLDENNESIWQTFKYPTDTILPGQILEIPSNLRSRYSQEDYSDGDFQLSLQPDGNLVLYFLPVDITNAYWQAMSLKNNTSRKLVFDENGSIYLQEANNRIFSLTRNHTGSSEDFYHRAIIDYDGVFRQYRYPKFKSCEQNWSEVQRIPEDICLTLRKEKGSAVCGFNSYCTSEMNEKAECLCPNGYSYRIPYDPREGCRPDFELPSCLPNGWDAKHEEIHFDVYDNTDWPLSDYDLQIGEGVDLEKCKQLCLDDCFCSVVIHNGQKCWKKKQPLSNGRKSKSVNRTALMKVPKNIAAAGRTKNDKSTLVLVISILLGSSVFVNILLLFAISFAIFLYNKKLLNFSSVSSVSATNVRSYTYKELEEATGGFKQILGKGAFGTVYKGVLASDHPRRFIAVKKLGKVEQEGQKEFKTEVSVIGQTHHKNLVRLLGFCEEGEHRLLVYEYMSNGSLASFLFGITRPDWNQRVQISFGIARGLFYLHEECSTQIIHCDIKPQNILLDEFLTPRISDFGLAKLLLAEQSRVARTNIRGTVGYFAPEWFMKGSITVKVDVYSFGVMLLELICCKSSVVFGMGDQEEALMDWVYDCYIKKKLDKLVENDEEARNDKKRLERLVMVAIWCIQEDASLRPSMKKVTQMLEGVINVAVPPRPSNYSSTFYSDLMQ